MTILLCVYGFSVGFSFIGFMIDEFVMNICPKSRKITIHYSVPGPEYHLFDRFLSCYSHRVVVSHSLNVLTD